MADTLTEKITKPGGISWLRTHGADPEGFAFCSSDIYAKTTGITESKGQITCPSCIRIIEACKAIADADLSPEYRNELILKRFKSARGRI